MARSLHPNLRSSPTRLLIFEILLFSHSVVSDSATPWTVACQASLSSTNSWSLCPLSWWCHPTISSSVTLFSFCLQSFPASGSFPMSWLFASGGQSIGASASASVFPKSIQGWFPLRLTGLISLLSKGHCMTVSRWFILKKAKYHLFVTESEVSQKDKNKYHILTHVWSLKKLV